MGLEHLRTTASINEAEQAARDHLRTVVNACCDKHELMNMHHCLNKLLPALLEDGEKEVHDAIFIAMSRDEKMTLSCWIAPAMKALFDVTL